MIRIALVLLVCMVCTMRPSSAAENLVGDALPIDQHRRSFIADELNRLEAIRSQSHIVSVTVLPLNPQALNSDEIAIRLPNGELATYRATSRQRNSDDVLVWKGASTAEIVDGRARDVAELFSRAAKQSRTSASVLGWLVWKGTRYEIDILKEGMAILMQVRPGVVPQHPKDWTEIQDRATGNSKPKAEFQSEKGVVAAQVIYTANLLFAVTPQAASYFGASLQARIDQVVSDVNNSFAGSNAPLRIARVGGISTQAIDYSSIGYAHSRGYSLDQMQERDPANADLVAIIGMFGNDGCGIATVNATAEDSQILLKANCLYLSRNLAHELGHIMGGYHPVEFDSRNTPFPWGHGFFFRDPSILYPGKAYCAGTIMAAGYTFPNLTNCITDGFGKPDTTGDGSWNRFSTPVRRASEPLIGSAATADMVRVISESASRISTFRETKLASTWRARCQDPAGS